jgi:organic hydroperoxide reductase OsmC/OhrA
MSKLHAYAVSVEWTGNPGPSHGQTGPGTTGYRDYKRDHTIRIANKPDLLGSADPTFRGDPSRHNPEELLVAALSACHMMSFLHVCVMHGVIVTAYTDNATGTMETIGDGGRMAEVVLHPRVTVADSSMINKANELHDRAHELCFIANSVNFPVRCEANCRVKFDR